MPEPINIEDPKQLTRYLREQGYLPHLVQAHIQNLEGGVSNRTVLVEFGDHCWVLKQALGRLRVSVDWFADPARIQREAHGLRWLQQLAPPGSVPDLVFEDPRNHILGMQAVPRPHENWKTVLLRGQIDPHLVRQFGQLLGNIHSNAYLLQAEMATQFGDRSFFESLRLEPYYAYAANQVPEAAGFLSELIETTRATRLTLVHGDYSPKNILVFAGRLVLLDHEVIHFGDPSFDLGFSLTHLLSKAHHLPERRMAIFQAALLYWETYRGLVGHLDWADRLAERAAHQTLGCLLARVAGRSPLEYLTDEEKRRQQRVVVDIMASPPGSIPELIERFLEGLAGI
jgi:tRNA A-37 threonylcarbamoyl transferase component Bud32